MANQKTVVFVKNLKSHVPFDLETDDLFSRGIFVQHGPFGYLGILAGSD